VITGLLCQNLALGGAAAGYTKVLKKLVDELLVFHHPAVHGTTS